MARQGFPLPLFCVGIQDDFSEVGGEQAPLPVKRSKTRKAKWRGRVFPCRFFCVREFRMTSESGIYLSPREKKENKKCKIARRGFPLPLFYIA